MIKVYAGFLLLAVFAAMAAPTDRELEPLEAAVQEEDRADRQRRLTCDLLSFMGDTACAANCISMGKAGGHCESGICVCRRETFVEQMEKRWGPFPEIPDNFNPSVQQPILKNAPNPYS